MKTRTLLLLAVGCGLVILVAGSIKLFLVADDTAPAHLAIGERGTIGDMTVTVESVRHAADQTLVAVSLIGADDDDGAKSFVFVASGKEVSAIDPPAGEGEACASTAVDSVTRCVLAFDTPDGQGVLRYDRAGKTLRWDIVGQPAG